MGFLNPFNAIFETKKYPHARTLRTSFKQKLKDTYFVWAGSFTRGSISWPPKEKKQTHNRVKQDHFGLFDYLILFLDTLIMRLIRLTEVIINTCKNEIKNKNPMVILASPILLPLFYAFSLAMASVVIGIAILRYASAAIFTLAVSPFVLITHFGAKLISRKYFAEINQINVVLNNCGGLGFLNCSIDNLSTFLIKNKLTLHDLKFSKITEEEADNNIKIEFVNKNREKRNVNNPLFSISLDNVRNTKTYSALCKLNIGGLFYKTEKIRDKKANETLMPRSPN